MMLCKADFEDLFPDLFPQQPTLAGCEVSANVPDAPTSLARRPENAIDTVFMYGWPGLMMANPVVASASVAAANEAVWNSFLARDSR